MIELVIDQRRRNIGSFEVGRVLPFAKRRMVGSFIFFDHMGPVDLPRGLAREADVLPHPHVELELGARIALPREHAEHRALRVLRSSSFSHARLCRCVVPYSSPSVTMVHQVGKANLPVIHLN